MVGLLLHCIHHAAAERREDGGGQVLSVPNHAGSLLKLVAPPRPHQLPREPQPGGRERAPAAQAAAWVMRAVRPGLPPHQRVSSRAQWLQGWGDSHGCSSRVPPSLAATGAGPCTDPSTIPVPELGGRGHRPVLSWLKLDGAHPTSGAVLCLGQAALWGWDQGGNGVGTADGRQWGPGLVAGVISSVSPGPPCLSPDQRGVCVCGGGEDVGVGAQHGHVWTRQVSP